MKALIWSLFAILILAWSGMAWVTAERVDWLVLPTSTAPAEQAGWAIGTLVLLLIAGLAHWLTGLGRGKAPQPAQTAWVSHMIAPEDIAAKLEEAGYSSERRAD